jgi:hypothetical protein
MDAVLGLVKPGFAPVIGMCDMQWWFIPKDNRQPAGRSLRWY